MEYARTQLECTDEVAILKLEIQQFPEKCCSSLKRGCRGSQWRVAGFYSPSKFSKLSGPKRMEKSVPASETAKQRALSNSCFFCNGIHRHGLWRVGLREQSGGGF